MVKELLEQPGSAYDPVLFEFVTNVVNDQATEIERMNALLVRLSDDPRAGLSAGLNDAGQAKMHFPSHLDMIHLSSPQHHDHRPRAN